MDKTISDRQKVISVIHDLESQLSKYKITLEVLDSLNPETPVKVVQTTTKKKKGKKALTLNEGVIADIKEAEAEKRDISTSELIDILAKRKNTTREKAGNSIYPTLTYLKGKDLIEPYKKGTMNGSYWKLKSPAHV